MNDITIRVENLSKKYTIGAAQQRHDTLRDLIVDAWRGMPHKNGKNEDTTLWALKDVSFEVKQGDVVGIIGRNGAGKSTLLKILSRITEPTMGRAVVNGRVGSLLEVGTGFHPELTGRENIYLNGAILGMTRKEIDRNFDEIVAFSEMERFIDTPVKRYSSGMYVRLAFAVAAYLEPEVLLVDEVLAVGDAPFQKKCIGKMEDVAREGRTVLFVSHNMGAISSICEKCVMLSQGGIIANGPTDLVITEYIKRNNDAGSIPISLRNDREGNGRLRVIDCKLSKELTGSSVNEFFTGDNIFINLLIKSERETDAWIHVSINDSIGKTITAISNRTAGLRPLHINKQKKITLQFPECRLLEGKYNIGIRVHSSSPLELADEITNAEAFTIHPYDFYHSGFIVGSNYGVVTIPYNWIS